MTSQEKAEEMFEKELIPNEIAIEANQYGIEPSKAANLIGNLPQITTERDAMSTQYNEIIRMDIEDPNTAKLARELRIKIKDNRTKGITVWHKTTKDYFLKGGQFVDSIKRKEESVNLMMEESLEQIEKHFEIKKAKEKEELKAKRISQIDEYKSFIPYSIDLSELSEDEFQNLYNGAKLQHEAKVEADNIAEQQRIENEKKQRIISERRDKMMPYSYWIDEFFNIDMSSITDEDIESLISKAVERRELEKKEAERKIKELEEKRLLQEAETKKLQEKLKKETQEKKRLEDEVRKNKEREAQEKKDKEEKENALKNADDRVILLEISNRIENLHFSFQGVRGEEAKEIIAATEAYLYKISKYIKEEAELMLK